MSDVTRGPRPPAGSGASGAPVTRPVGTLGAGATTATPAQAGQPAGRPGPPPGATRPAQGTARTTRRARLTIRRVDPWSVLKFSFVFSVAILVVWIVAVVLLYGVLSGMGVFDKLNSVLADFSTKDGIAQWQLRLTSSRVIGWSALVGAINAVLFTALATLGAFMYNLCSSLSGGLDVTLTERD